MKKRNPILAELSRASARPGRDGRPEWEHAGNNADLTAEQREQHEARIAREAERVQAELQRLGLRCRATDQERG